MTSLQISKKNIVVSLLVGVFAFSILVINFSFDSLSYAQNGVVNNGQSLVSNIAENLFNTKILTLDNNVKTLIILIPNEGHHGSNEDPESRLIDQQFVPGNSVIHPGTTVAWFNGDVGHERTVDVKKTDGSSLFNTGVIKDMDISPTYTFTQAGTYNYEAEGDPGVIMRGTIQVVGESDNNNNNDSSSSSSSSNQFSSTPSGSSTMDTVGVLMVPTQNIDTYIKEIQDAGLTISGQYDFKDLRGGQKGTGDTQTLIVWTTSGKDLNTIIPPISKMSSSLPYS